MKKLFVFLTAAFAIAILMPLSASAATVGGDEAWFNVYCNVDGASVYMDSDYKGEIVQNILSIPVYTTATPYTTITVEKAGYTTWSEGISNFPAMGETVDVYATLNPEPTTEPTLIGGDVGYYVVYCNVDGASVYFGSDYEGDISNGELTVQVYTTGTPYTTYTVQKDGYTSFTGQITEYPAAGETDKLYANLVAAEPTQSSPISVFTIIGAMLFCMILFTMMTRKD